MRQSKFHRDIPNNAKIAESFRILFSDMAGWTALRSGDENDDIMTFNTREEAEQQAKIEEENYRDAYDHYSPSELDEIVPEYKVISSREKIYYYDEGSQA